MQDEIFANYLMSKNKTMSILEKGAQVKLRSLKRLTPTAMWKMEW